MSELRQLALAWLCETDAIIKAAGVLALGNNEDFHVETHAVITSTKLIPGRPSKPILVSPLDLPKRSMRTLEGRAALIHALAHIEFNAINLAQMQFGDLKTCQKNTIVIG